jgi:hypothetical protein
MPGPRLRASHRDYDTDRQASCVLTRARSASRNASLTLGLPTMFLWLIG